MKNLASYSNTKAHKTVPMGKTVMLITMFSIAGYMLVISASNFI